MNSDPDLRLVPPDEKADPGEAPPAPESRDQSDLIAELLAETGMLPPDKLEDVRARALGGSFSQALLDEGLATSMGIARRLAEQYHLPLVDLAEAGIDAEAARVIPLAVLERVCAIPFAYEGETLRIAITDPQNVRGLDELRLATQHPVAFHVAAQADVLAEIRRISRASGALHSVLIEDAVAEATEDEEVDDLEVDDGISDAPLVRLVNSIIFQAAEEGASDIHFEPQEGALVVRFRVDGVLRVAQRIPTQLSTGVTTRLKVLAEARHRRAAKAAGRTHLAERRHGRPSARHSSRDPPDSRRRVSDHAPPRQVAQRADARGARALRGDARAALPDRVRGRRGPCS